MHVHSCCSEDGLSSPSSIIKKIKEKQLTGIAITDHNNCNAWKELTALAKKEGVLIVKGEEIKIKKQGRTVGEVLGYFMNKEVKPGQFGEVMDALDSQDAVAAIAHPFDTFRNAFLDLDNAIKRVKVIETFNSRCLSNAPNLKAARYAKKRGLSAIAGSDAHTPWEIGNAFTECNAGSEEELRKAIRLGKTKINGRLASPFIHIFSTIAKLRIIKKL